MSDSTGNSEASTVLKSALVIAVDGPAAAGKGTLARALAAAFDLVYLDTGALYRGVGVAVLRAGGDPADPVAAEQAALSLDPATLSDPKIRSEEGGLAASKVAAIPAVRAALLTFQRSFAATPPGGKAGAVLDGRDIGTVVCPDAPVKLFITASAEVRAQRRWKELRDKGQDVTPEAVLSDLQARDLRDGSRSVAPLTAAEDAHVIDTS
ncbi:MAG: (d)CMP kinase, partial [Rhodospirillaceae bacterium]